MHYFLSDVSVYAIVLALITTLLHAVVVSNEIISVSLLSLERCVPIIPALHQMFLSLIISYDNLF